MQSTLLKMVSCLGDLLREFLLPNLVCYCVLSARNIYLDEMVFWFLEIL